MLGLLIFAIVLLVVIITVQFGKIAEISARIKGEEVARQNRTNRTGQALLIFGIVFIASCILSALYYKNYMLGYGPHEAASAHGGEIDKLFNVTLFFTGIVFVVTQFLTFWYAYKYRERPEAKAVFLSHNNTLEMVWTGTPLLVLVVLVVQGLAAWNNIMGDLTNDEEAIQIEATGYQFAWDIRYAGADNVLGNKEFTLIDPATNPVGQEWADAFNIDDFFANEIVLPVNKKVRVSITSKDVLHNFFLPHFRMKMDAVPGMPTYFVFTPTITTAEYRQRLKEYKEYQVPFDEDEPDGPKRWEMFEYELACAELCGKGHYSMRKIVRIVSEAEYNQWLKKQKSYYLENIRNTNKDPFKGKLLPVEIELRAKNLKNEVESVISEKRFGEAIQLTNIFFETGSASLKDDSKYELDNISEILKSNDGISIVISGHTDNTGDLVMNQILSEQRANSVISYLTSKGVAIDRLSGVGYGPNRPLSDNDTPEGRQLNRRIEMSITSQTIN